MVKAVNTRMIYAKLAKKYGLSMKDIDLACSSQFSFVRKIMKKGDFEGVRLPFFGRFWVKPRRKLEMDLRKKRKDEREATQ